MAVVAWMLTLGVVLVITGVSVAAVAWLTSTAERRRAARAPDQG